jgi:hypothetical protein
MADLKISQLTTAETLVGTEVLPVVQSGSTVKVSVSALTAGLSTIPVTKGGTGVTTAFTAGSVVFAGVSGAYSQNNSKFFWDNTNLRLCINGTAPDARLQIGDSLVGANATAIGAVMLNEAPGALSDAGGIEWKTSVFGAGYGWKIISIDAAGGAQLLFGSRQNSATWTERMRIDSAGGVGIGATANASAILDAQSTTKGVRMPNMTSTQKNAIASPAAGLMVFDTTLAKLCVYSGAAWQTITSI